jgi:peroxiredoxin
MRDIDKILREYGDKGLRCFGITKEKPARDAEVRKTMDGLGLSYPTLWHADEVIGATKPYPSDVTPSLFVIDRDGIVRTAQAGGITERFLRDELKKLGFE